MILMVVAVLGRLVDSCEGEMTVVVTPRPRWYVPNKVVREPHLDPSNPAVPSLISLSRRPVINLTVLPNSLIAPVMMVDHRLEEGGGGRLKQLKTKQPTGLTTVSIAKSQPIVVHPTPFGPRPPSREGQGYSSLLSKPIVVASHPFEELQGQRHEQQQQQQEQAILVESLPALSLLYPGSQQASQELPDFLTPPKFPSVYDHEFTIPDSNSIQQKPKKKKKPKEKKQKVKLTSKEDDRFNGENDINSKLGLQESGERVEFQLHGQNGPDSYKFGFDTGAGKNRQFRFEEKDANGNVRGHYGYYDTTGKLQIFNYRADETGYHAEQAD